MCSDVTWIQLMNTMTFQARSASTHTYKYKSCSCYHNSCLINMLQHVLNTPTNWQYHYAYIFDLDTVKMAEQPPLQLVSFNRAFDEEISCGMCLDQYNNPKTLPCHHSFCLKCIEKLPVKIN